MSKREEHYLGNPLLKKANQDLEFTKDQVLEIQKCMEDPQYFVENYIKIVSLDKGLVPFKMYNFQKDMLGTFHKNRFTIFLTKYYLEMFAKGIRFFSTIYYYV